MTNAQPEPSMEEILASIRRIISEDEEEGVADDGSNVADETPSAPELVLEPEPITETVQESLLRETTIEAIPEKVDVGVIGSEIAHESVEETVPFTTSFLDNAEPHLVTEDIEMVKQNVADALQDDHPLVDVQTAAVASQAFQTLSQSVRISEGPGKTLEDIVSEMLRPMVKEWLDANLPQIVEEKVEEEVQRVARRRS